jgi:membrane fusion protein (multidrug efflux system)
VQRVPVKIWLDPKNPITARLRPGLSVTATVDTHDWLQAQARPQAVTKAQQ